MMNFDVLCVSNRRLLILLQLLRPTELVGSFIFKYYGEKIVQGYIMCSTGPKKKEQAGRPIFDTCHELLHVAKITF